MPKGVSPNSSVRLPSIPVIKYLLVTIIVS